MCSRRPVVVLGIVSLGLLSPLQPCGRAHAGELVRGDVNQDGPVDISNAMATLGFLFLHQPASLACLDAAAMTWETCSSPTRSISSSSSSLVGQRLAPLSPGAARTGPPMISTASPSPRVSSLNAR